MSTNHSDRVIAIVNNLMTDVYGETDCIVTALTDLVKDLDADSLDSFEKHYCSDED